MKFSNVHLYGALDSNVADSYKAKEYIDSVGIPYNHLFYQDAAQFPAVLAPISGWFSNRTDITFPFLIWDDGDQRKIAIGLKEIKAVNFKPKPAPKSEE